MPKPTKFDLMRAGRDRAQWMRRDLSIFDSLLQMSDKVHITKPQRYAVTSVKVEAPEPSVPTMEIDGVLYCEAPERGGVYGEDNCHGCAFDNDMDLCNRGSHQARSAFGLSCGIRRVIYIRA